MLNKLRMMLSIIKGDAIVINSVGNNTKVYVGARNDKDTIKKVASDFFKEAYKLS